MKIVFFIFDPTVHDCCPDCGWVKPKKGRSFKTADGKLVEYFEDEEQEKEHLFRLMKADYYKLEWVRKTKKLHPNWTFNNLLKKYPTVFNQLVKVTVVPTQFLKDLE